MNRIRPEHFSGAQQVTLIALRTAIGWHFLYEGYYKFLLPGWSAEGAPLGPWTSAGYLRAASGPLAPLLQRLLAAGWTPWIDQTVKIGLVLVGLSLLLGLFTRLGGWGALLCLTLFYLVAIPWSGTQRPGSEGAYLIVNKILIEGIAVCVLLAFDTGRMAGLDRLWLNRKGRRAAELSERRFHQQTKDSEQT